MEGFLSLEQAAQQLQFSVPELSRQIQEGRVVAILRDGSAWLSAGEVSRLKRQSEKGVQSSAPAQEELRLLRLSETPKPVAKRTIAPPKGESAKPSPPPPQAPPEPLVSTAVASAAEERAASQIRELNRRCAELELRNQELEARGNRLKSGLQETEATLKRNRTARANLENDVIGLQDQLSKARARNEALEREIQHLGTELERTEDAHSSELRRLRSNKDRGGEEREANAASPHQVEHEGMRDQMMEKDRLLAQEYELRGSLRSQLEDKQQKYFELKARYDKEKTEWSELLAQALQNQNHMRQQIEELKIKNHPKGWNPFRREK